ncbi:putative cobalt transporter CbtA [Micromonospora pisi]|uniref:Putative cobalt transporter CbtA n=1 Tax=Micromonospora pisi TaxID=589240 RepID=A0A495JBL5_9ACTN|nr:CbtA family protein [Micromonospora pisi]RKR86295.1 putative cobalt transporter CbtA [Micromonospora pisi]
MLSARSLLIRGMLVGLAAGVAAYLFATLFGEGPVGQAIDFESAQGAAAHAAAHAADAGAHTDAAEPELVSRLVQSTIGLATAALVYGVALGGLFALAFAIAYGRIGRFTPRATAALVALGGFVTVALVPFLKYPANPPATGNPDTLDQRTVLYFLMIVIGVAAGLLALHLGRWLQPRYGAWNATLLAVGAYAVFITVVQFSLPTINEVPDGFPALVLWEFRLASLGTQFVTWATLGLLFGALTERRVRASATRRVGETVPA